MFAMDIFRRTAARAVSRLSLRDVTRAFLTSPSHGTTHTLDCTNSCWNCAYKHACEMFCPSCETIQCAECATANMNFFQLLNINESFDISVHSLKNCYIRLQSRLHPDKFMGCSEREQGYSNAQSAAINEAHKTLADPIKRGMYLLQLNGVNVDSETSADESEIVSEIFKLNFMCEESDDICELNTLQSRMEREIASDEREANAAFIERNFDVARQILFRMKYRRNLKQKVEEKVLKMSLL